MGKKCRFQLKWLDAPQLKDWLKVGDNDDSARCIVCKKQFSVVGGGITLINQHAKTKGHMEAMKILKKQPSLMEEFTKPSPKNAGQARSSEALSVSVEKPSTSAALNVSHPIQSHSLFDSQVAPSRDLRDAVTRAEIMLAFKIVSSHSPMNFAENLTEMMSLAFPDSEIAQKLTFSPDKAAYIINFGLGPYYEREINNILLNTDFLCAQFDESK